MAVGNGYWISGKTGKCAKVSRHELWLKDTKNLGYFGLEALAPVLDELNVHRDVDEIRMTGLKAGLVRVRDNNGVFSIQFWAPRGSVSRFLQNTLEALTNINEQGYMVWVNNLFYSDSKTLPWQEFERAVSAGEPILINEDRHATIDDIPDDSALIRRIDERLVRLNVRLM